MGLVSLFDSQAAVLGPSCAFLLTAMVQPEQTWSGFELQTDLRYYCASAALFGPKDHVNVSILQILKSNGPLKPKDPTKHGF